MSTTHPPAAKRICTQPSGPKLPALLLDLPSDVWGVVLWWLCSYQTILFLLRVCKSLHTRTLGVLVAIADRCLRFPLRLDSFNTTSQNGKTFTNFLFSAVRRQLYAFCDSTASMKQLAVVPLRQTRQRAYYINGEPLYATDAFPNFTKYHVFRYILSADVCVCVNVNPGLVDGMVQFDISIMNYRIKDIDGALQMQLIDPWWLRNVSFGTIDPSTGTNKLWFAMPTINIRTVYASNRDSFDVVVTASLQDNIPARDVTTIATVHCVRDSTTPWVFITSVSHLTCLPVIPIPQLISNNKIRTVTSATHPLLLGGSRDSWWWWLAPQHVWPVGHIVTTPRNNTSTTIPKCALGPNATKKKMAAMRVHATFGHIFTSDITNITRTPGRGDLLYREQITDTLLAVVFRGSFVTTIGPVDPTCLLFYVIDLTTDTIALRAQYEVWPLVGVAWHVYVSRIWCHTDPADGTVSVLAAVFCSERMHKNTSCLLRLYNLSQQDSDEPFYMQRVGMHNVLPVTPEAMDY